jgi:CSLREA domain-containing protein
MSHSQSQTFSPWRRRLSRRAPSGFSRIGSRYRPRFDVMEERTLLSSFVVSNTNDSGTGSLRQAIQGANAQSGDNDITFDPTAFASAQTITLSSGQLELGNTSGTETITGPAAGVTVNAGGTSRVFQIDSGVTASISGLTITGGSIAGQYGGGVYNDGGYLTLNNVTIRGNYDSNSDGGGLGVSSGATTLTNCTVSGNMSGGKGGGIGVFSGTTSLQNCTLSGNSSIGRIGYGGGMWANGTTTVTDCTVSGNTANYYGGGLLVGYSGTMTIGNTIVAGNNATKAPDAHQLLGGVFVSAGNNLIGETDGSSGWIGSDLTGTAAAPLDAVLAPLGNYGGPTQTMALLPGSPALGAGNNALIPTGITIDQRGLPRIVNGRVDIGAFESSGFTLAYTSGSGQTAGVFPNPLVATVTANNPIEPVAGGQVTFTPPGSAASAVLTGNPATLSASGTASIAAASNGVVGSYTVSATAHGAAGMASFSLTNVALKSIAVTPANPELEEGVAGQFTAMGTYLDGSAADLTDLVTWASATPSVATISGTGLATALIPGTNAITASLAGVTSPADTLTVIASFVVNTTADTFGFWNGTVSLREAIAGANAHPGQTITFDPTVFASAQTITLSLGQLELSNTTGATTITSLAAGVTVSAGEAIRVFQVDGGVTASMSGLTITGVHDTHVFGDRQGGGGVANYGGTLTLTDCTVSGNSVGASGAFAEGGGVFNLSGTVNLINCTLSGNSASSGAAVYSYKGQLTLTNCAISGNSAYYGAVKVVYGSTVLTNCTVTDNTAMMGAGLFNRASAATLTNCTVGDNSASGQGGGLYTRSGHGSNSKTGGTTLIDCTVSGNTASNGGGVYTLNGTTTLGNTIVAGNNATTGPDLSGAGRLSSEGNNLIGETDGSSGWVGSDLTGTIAAPLDPILAPVGNYGGPTQTMALLPGSPAIDAGNNALIPTGITDQRGLPRIVNGTVDIGAFESSGFTIAATSGSGQTAGGAFSVPLVVTVTANNSNEPVAGGQVTFTPLGSGASAELTGNPATLSASGTASVTATGNGVAGSFTVVALANGAPGLASFSLTNVALLAIAVSPGNPDLAEDVTGQFTATGTYSDGSTGDLTDFVTWASATPSVATINSTGLATALAPGTSVITASLADVTSPADTLTVIVPSYVVSNTNDSGPGSLRQAIEGANAQPGANDITFDPTVFATPQTIILTSGELELSHTIGTETIMGPAVGVTVSAGGTSRVFQIDSGVTASISGLTITDGNANNGGGLADYGGMVTLTDCTVSDNSASNNGGGVYVNNGGTATLTDCTVTGNSSSNNGAGLVNDGSTVTMSGCTVSDNSANSSGGGVSSPGQGSTTTLTNCTVSGNSAGSGGGMYDGFSDTLVMTNCTVSGNFAGGGGGLATTYDTNTLTNCTISSNSTPGEGGGFFINNGQAGGSTTLTDCTVSGNSAGGTAGGFFMVNGTTTLTNCTVSGNSSGGDGGAMYNIYVNATLTNCTVSDNSALGGGGLYNGRGTTTENLGNSIVAGNTAGTSPDVSGGFTSLGNNLIGEADGSSGWVGSDLTGTVAAPLDAMLAALANNGGPTQTMALLPGSPAIAAGNIALIPSGVTTDQRGPGFPRIVNGTVDIGAVEFGGSTGESQTISFSTLANQTYGAASVDLTASASSNLPVSFAIISGPATISGSVLTITGAGNVVVEASQAGNDVFAPAAPVDQTLTVNTVTLTILPNGGQSKVYGAAVPGLSESATGFVDGDTASLLTGALGTIATASSAVGTYAFTLGSLSAGPNYTLALAASPPTLAVTRAPLSIKPNAGQSKVYGAAVPGLTQTATGFVNGDTASLLTGALGTVATASSAVGTYAFTLGSLSAGPDYALALAASPPTLVVTPAPLSIKPNTGQSKVYGAEVAGLTETATGFVDGDAASLLTGALGTKATASSAAGTYAFTLGSLSAGLNYSLALAASPPTFAVSPASLVITANSTSITSGQALPGFTASYTGLVNGDSSASLTTPPTLSTTASAGSPAGTYPITVSGASSPNYTITYIPGTLTVTQPPATVEGVSIQNVKLSKHKTVQEIVLRFSEALNGAAAENVNAYSLATVAKSKKQKSKPVALSSATYNSSAFTVSLLTREKLALNPPLDLTVHAASLLDALGRALDGNDSDQAGANYTAVLSKAGATVTSARIGRLSSRAVDAVLAAGLRSGR